MISMMQDVKGSLLPLVFVFLSSLPSTFSIFSPLFLTAEKLQKTHPQEGRKGPSVFCMKRWVSSAPKEVFSLQGVLPSCCLPTQLLTDIYLTCIHSKVYVAITHCTFNCLYFINPFTAV